MAGHPSARSLQKRVRRARRAFAHFGQAMAYFRSCLLCYIPFWGDDPLCPSCADQLWACCAPVVREVDGYYVRSLFEWGRFSPPAIRWLSRAMKRRSDRWSWKLFAHWMIFLFESAPEDFVFVPVPSLGPNHALGLASALAHNLRSAELADILAPLPKGRVQKRLSRHERAEIRFENRDEFCREFTDVVIVDDIVTTGATAAAAYRALGRPKNCEIWCLIDRRPCDTDMPLL